ncbi:ankyrin repeat domain-containing protein [Hyphobacterium sp. CCMP332]|nr:ankyrin repeat domain-containing protein [Hyphobacterium sp. CCMP332]
MKNLTSLLILALLFFVIACTSENKNKDESSEKSKPGRNIHEASFFGDVESIKEHIAYGSDLNVKDDYGSTPLHIAITFNKKEVAQELIRGGADLESKSNDGSTPLISAAFFGRTEIVRSLLDHGANPNAQNQYNAKAYDNVTIPFDQLKPVYDQLSRDLGPLGFKLDYDELKKERLVIAQMLETDSVNITN